MILLTIVWGTLLALFVTLYWRSIKESQDLTNYALLILLDERVNAAQRASLQQFVQSTTANSAVDLGVQTNRAVKHLAARLSDTLLGTAGLLWKLRADNLKST